MFIKVYFQNTFEAFGVQKRYEISNGTQHIESEGKKNSLLTHCNEI
jgi:hypothetical protein